MKAARAVLDDHGGDVDALRAAEPWMFAEEPRKQTGKTGLPNACAASDEGKQMKQEAGVLDRFVEAGSELQRTQVAPEADAFTFAMIALRARSTSYGTKRDVSLSPGFPHSLWQYVNASVVPSII